MKEIFVSLEIAKKLKEIGFNEPCLAYYYLGNESDLVTITKRREVLTDNFVLGTFTQSNYAGISTPTYEQVFKWFRNKGLEATIERNFFLEDEYSFVVVNKNKLLDFVDEETGEDVHIPSFYHYEEVFNTYSEARENLILKMIELYER